MATLLDEILTEVSLTTKCGSLVGRSPDPSIATIICEDSETL